MTYQFSTISFLILAVAVALPKKTFARSPDDLNILHQVKVFFAHQSVGENILSAMPVMRVVATRSPAQFGNGVLAHTQVGRNEDPLSKIDNFAELMRQGAIGGAADIAAFKFCYIDFDAGTDVPKLFLAYQKTMDQLAAEFPNTRFVHITVPLTTVASGPKAWLKHMLGKSVWGEAENQQRHRFNQLLRQTYSGRAAIFDLAAIEAQGSDGVLQTFDMGSLQYPHLANEYTSDGGHLNAAGAKVVAQAFAHTLARVAAQK